MQKKILIGEELEFAAATLSCIGDGVISTDINGHIKYMNKIAEDIIEWKAFEVVGKEFDLLFNIFNSESKMKIKSPLSEVLIKDKIIDLQNNTELNSKNNLRKYLSATFSSVKDLHGSIMGAVVIFRDITKQKNLENEQLNREENAIKTRDYCNNLLDQVPTMVVRVNGELECEYLNKKWKDFTGFNLDEITSCSCLNIIHPEDLNKCKLITSYANHKKESYKYEARIKRYDDQYRWCLVEATPYYDINGEFDGHIGVIFDITGRKEAEKVFNRYQLFSKNARDIMFFIDEDGFIIEANKAAVKAYGYTYEELCKKNIHEIRKSWSYTRKQMEKAMQSGVFFEAIHYRKDGTSFQVEVSSQAAKIGEKYLLLSIVRDISERKKIDKKIAENQLKYRSLFMNMRSGYAYYSVIYREKENESPVDLKIIEVNDAFEQMVGITKDKLIGMYLTKLLTKTSNIFTEKAKSYVKRLAQGESVYIEEIFIESFSKWFSIAIYSPEKGRIVTIVSDISRIKESEIAQKRAKEIAEAANKVKSEFLANMSHEIRTPINGVIGMVDLTLLTDLNEIQKDNLNTAKACAYSLLKIINNILDFSKIEAGKLYIENENFNIKELIEDIVKLHSPRVLEKRLELNYKFSTNIPKFIIGDSIRLRQILNNLISNAIKFTLAGEINVVVKRVPSSNNEVKIKFTVSDTGIGIAHKDIGRLFQSFVQIDGSYTRKVGGTGLGLVISRQLVEIMGGKIWLESEEGIGSNFHFLLEFKIGSSEVKKNQQMLQIPKVDKHLYILLVEDDEINQKVIKKILEKVNHIVEVANNGKEAVVLFKKNKYDVILMDIQMPEIDGIKATKMIREIENPSNRTPIIALTAYALQGDKERFLALDMDGYISKPIQMSELFYTLNRLLLTQGNRVKNETGKMIDEYYEKTIEDKPNHKNRIKNTLMIKQMLAKITELIKEFEIAMDNNNFSEIEQVAHKIKIASNEVGFYDIKDAAFKIELAVRRNNLDDVKKYIEKINHKFSVLKHSIISQKGEV